MEKRQILLEQNTGNDIKMRDLGKRRKIGSNRNEGRGHECLGGGPREGSKRVKSRSREEGGGGEAEVTVG